MPDVTKLKKRKAEEDLPPTPSPEPAHSAHSSDSGRDEGGPSNKIRCAEAPETEEEVANMSSSPDPPQASGWISLPGGQSLPEVIAEKLSNMSDCSDTLCAEWNTDESLPEEIISSMSDSSSDTEGAEWNTDDSFPEEELANIGRSPDEQAAESNSEQTLPEEEVGDADPLAAELTEERSTEEGVGDADTQAAEFTGERSTEGGKGALNSSADPETGESTSTKEEPPNVKSDADTKSGESSGESSEEEQLTLVCADTSKESSVSEEEPPNLVTGNSEPPAGETPAEETD